MLVYYSKLANDRKLSTLFLVLIFISIMFILSYPFTVLGLICLPIFTVLYVIFLKKNKKRYDKYYPLASTYAYNIVLIEEEIAIYTKLISKLTK